MPQNSSASAGEKLVEAHDIGVLRDDRWLIRHIDLSVRREEIVTLIGPNGSGKSTTAKAVLGLLKLTEGRVERTGKLKVGYVPQKLAIDWTLPLRVERLMTLTARHNSKEILDALTEVEIPHLKDADIQTLSGGEFQRVLLARALIRKPDLLVLDEPVQGVDFTGEIALYELISKIRDRVGCGILLISHDLHIVMAATDTVVCLNGHVCCSGHPQSVAQSTQYRDLFGARGAEALAIYRHEHDHAHHVDGSIDHDCKS